MCKMQTTDKMKRALILFTRIPLAGKTKTRMMPKLTPDACAALHSALIKDAAKAAAGSSADVFVCYEGERASLNKLLCCTDVLQRSKSKVRYFPQKGDGLGVRMQQAIAAVLQKGYDAAVLTGTDIPALSAEQLNRAFRVLEERDVVLGATKDGGYYLIGMKELQPSVFSLHTYGTGSVFAKTKEAAEKEGLSVGYTAQLSDLDTPEDLETFRVQLRSSKRLRQTVTGKFAARHASISIIVPIYNEAATIRKLTEQLRPLLSHCEIILVDGGSTDGTAEQIDGAFHVIHSEKGRARQMNLGAQKSSGDILFFLHSDSELPPHPLGWIRKVMETHSAGCFGIAFHSCNFFMWTCRVISNHRVKDRKVMFGDQGIFIDRNLFFEAGMFPELPVMEDYQFSLTLKDLGVKLGMAGRRIYTSDRRFPKGTVPKLRLMWKMNRLRKQYRDGVPAEQIAAQYRDVR